MAHWANISTCLNEFEILTKAILSFDLLNVSKDKNRVRDRL
jgi:hypothetical protein